MFDFRNLNVILKCFLLVDFDMLGDFIARNDLLIVPKHAVVRRHKSILDQLDDKTIQILLPVFIVSNDFDFYVLIFIGDIPYNK